MKKKLITLFTILFITTISLFSQEVIMEPTQNPNVRYRLFSTNNRWTFLKLDTMTGKIWQVQFSIDGDEYRFETPLSLTDITNNLKQEKVIGRFTLYPTKNTYNFIMVDQIDGYTYQVQWSIETKHRYVLPILN